MRKQAGEKQRSVPSVSPSIVVEGGIYKRDDYTIVLANYSTRLGLTLCFIDSAIVTLVIVSQVVIIVDVTKDVILVILMVLQDSGNRGGEAVVENEAVVVFVQDGNPLIGNDRSRNIPTNIYFD